ncbi:hypothetical protein JOD28_001493 [Leuconostoc rapi]|nr:hypothetical protein [Leuconostoc rapi]
MGSSRSEITNRPLQSLENFSLQDFMTQSTNQLNSILNSQELSSAEG